MPRKRQLSATATVRSAPRRRRGKSPVASESESEHSSSDDNSDPDNDILEEEMYTPDGQHVLDFECVRDAIRNRVAEKTRSDICDIVL